MGERRAVPGMSLGERLDRGVVALDSARAATLDWFKGTLQAVYRTGSQGDSLLAEIATKEAVADAAAEAVRLAQLRTEMVVGLASVGADVVAGQAPFVLFRTPDAVRIRTSLQRKEIAVRRCDTFVGLGEQYLRAAVRREWPLLVQAIHDISPATRSENNGSYR